MEFMWALKKINCLASSECRLLLSHQILSFFSKAVAAKKMKNPYFCPPKLKSLGYNPP